MRSRRQSQPYKPHVRFSCRLRRYRARDGGRGGRGLSSAGPWWVGGAWVAGAALVGACGCRGCGGGDWWWRESTQVNNSASTDQQSQAYSHNLFLFIGLFLLLVERDARVEGTFYLCVIKFGRHSIHLKIRLTSFIGLILRK